MANILTDDTSPAERLHTPIATRLRDWVEPLVLPKPNTTAKKNTYGSLEEFASTFPNLKDQYHYQTSPLRLLRYLVPVFGPGTVVTCAERLDPGEFHLRGSTVYVFNPFFYKAAWMCGEQVQEVSFLFASGARPRALPVCNCNSSLHVRFHAHVAELDT